MANTKESRVTRPISGNATEELDGLNADTRRRSNPSKRLRRRMEATIEAKAKKRRKREAPASAAWKP